MTGDVLFSKGVPFRGQETARWLQALAAPSRRPRFDSQYPHCGSQPFVIPVSEDSFPVFASGTTHTVYTYTYQ